MKKEVLELLAGIDGTDIYKDIWNYVPEIDERLCNEGFQTGLIRVDHESDGYVMAVYRSQQIGKPIVTDWSFRVRYQNIDELADTIVRAELDGRALDRATKFSQEKFKHIQRALINRMDRSDDELER